MSEWESISVKGTPFAERRTKEGTANDGILRWLLTDANNTADIEIVASDGAVVRRYFDPFGNPRGTAPTWSSAHSFLNAPKSSVSGLTQLGARAYDAATGRFVTVDPLLSPYEPQQNNGYTYAWGSPVTRADPSGMRPLGQYDSGDPDYRGPGTDHTPPPAPGDPGDPSSPFRQSGGTGCASVQINCSSNEPPFVNVNQDRTPLQFMDYEYHQEHWLGIGLEDFSEEEALNVFKEHPGEIFPFEIEGCSSFATGDTCRLNALPQIFGDGAGDVWVRTTDREVEFTVVSNDYFDAPGSTVAFSVSQHEDGLYLHQDAYATRANAAIGVGIEVFHASDVTWSAQAAALRQAMLKYGR